MCTAASEMPWGSFDEVHQDSPVSSVVVRRPGGPAGMGQRPGC